MAEESGFQALVLDDQDGTVTAAVRQLHAADLPEGDVLVTGVYSSLNYKDGLALTGRARVVRRYPMVPGVDLVGTVKESTSPQWKPGDQVIMNGWGAGETHWGGYTQCARLRSEWLVRLPEDMTTEQAAQLGTAGYTAMLAVMALEEHGLIPDGGDIAVTGAAGGVGSLAVALLAQLGYRVVASTGRAETHEYLRELGAAEIVGRDALQTPSKRPLESARWGGAIDTVGGSTLAGLLRTMKPWTSIAVCGNAGGNALETTVLPFILRGVNLIGIDSNYCPPARRTTAWNRLARDFPLERLDRISRTVPLAGVPALGEEIVQGRIQGRVVVDVS
jgi:acrylyl-CoA reductase (NADPH)